MIIQKNYEKIKEILKMNNDLITKKLTEIYEKYNLEFENIIEFIKE